MSPVAQPNGHVQANGHAHVNGYGDPPKNTVEELKAIQRMKTLEGTPDLDPSKLTITLAESLKHLPEPSSLVFGQVMTDHMMVVSYEPETGWGAPAIQPYQPITLDPASSCFQYCSNVFEGMKAYLGSDGEPVLFRPDMNMARMQRSVERVALPAFDTDALLTLIKRLVQVEKHWIPSLPGYSLYIRPTIIGTRASLGVAASTHALLYIIMSPTGPYFNSGPKAISLLAHYENVRSWPGGTGEYKLGLNYAPTFEPQRRAAKLGYQQILWLLGPDRKCTEAGAMNFFVVVKRDDGDLDVITPPLDGTILPGVTRNSVLILLNSHSPSTPLPSLSPSQKLHTHERQLTMDDLKAYSEQGILLEAFCAGTAVIVAAVGRIGYEGKDITFPYGDGTGPVADALLERLTDIQIGRYEFNGWSVKC